LEFAKGTKFLVTGGAGFIGSNLCEAILEMGHAVRCLDDFSTGYRENIKTFQDNPDFELVEGDIRDFDACLSACEGIDFVLHQAAWGSVPRSVEMPLIYNEINITGTLNMLEAARRKGVKKFVYASSSSVYGDSPELPKKEGNEGNLLSPYAFTKLANEHYAALYTKLYGLDTYGLRYFNVFGRRQDPEGDYAAVIPKFIKTLLNGQAPTIHGDGTQSRDFTHIDNVVQANLAACHAPPEAAGRAYNIACATQTTLLELFDTLQNALNTTITPTFAPLRPGDIKHSNADITNAQNSFGYAPYVDFVQGIKKSIQWYKEELQ